MKRAIVTGILCSLLSFSIYAESESEFYTNLIRNALTAESQLRILLTVRDAQIADAGDFYAEALARVLQLYPNLRSDNEIAYADEALRLISDELAEGQSETGQNLWRVVNTSSNPLVRSGAIMAIGKVGATDLTPQVLRLLINMNSAPMASRLAGERLAYGAIETLGQFKEEDAYIPIFLAANGWYSDWVRSRARELLPEISSDPTEPLIQIIQGPYSFEHKYLALRYLENAEGVDDASKSRAAVAALNEGWRVFF